jgi:asparagine synthase (glutamine-hydrolysing)
MMQKRRSFLGAKGQVGEKAFYYAHNGLDFEFGSQPAQITMNRQVNMDMQAVHEYFIWGYVPEPRSACKKLKNYRQVTALF